MLSKSHFLYCINIKNNSRAANATVTHGDVKACNVNHNS